MLKEEKDIIKKLSDFKPVDEVRSGIFNRWHKYRIKNINYDKCRLIVYIFSDLLGCPVIHQPIEKVNWEISFKYKGIIGTFAHQKFGFRIYINNELDKDAADKISEEILKVLVSVIESLGPAVEVYAKKALSENNIIINNKLEDIELAYRYFNREAKKEKDFKSQVTPENLKEINDLSKAMELVKEDWIMQRSNTYNEEAAYFTFISLIEHLSVLFYAFNPEDNLNVRKFARKPWALKFETVFPMHLEEFKSFLERLRKISNYRRNPAAHGHITNKYTQAAFFFSKAKHRIPVSLYDDEVLSEARDTKVNLDILDDFLVMIRENNKTENIMQYLDSGFDISFSESSLKKYQNIKKLSKEELRELIDQTHRAWDDARNMDW